MREIKFRAWVEGSYIDGEKHMLEWHDMALLTFMGVTQDPRLTLMQYTGLTDKNGKEIYEGDILLSGTGHRNKVEWNATCGMWTLDDLQEFMCKLPDGVILPLHKFSEVIGNIYENPELLNP